jgi:hypothetical protein
MFSICPGGGRGRGDASVPFLCKKPQPLLFRWSLEGILMWSLVKPFPIFGRLYLAHCHLWKNMLLHSMLVCLGLFLRVKIGRLTELCCLYMGSSHRRKGAVIHIIDMVWLYLSFPVGRGGLFFFFQMISTCLRGT